MRFFVTIQLMRSKPRHLIACFLLVLLPLQAMASLAGYACVSSMAGAQAALVQQGDHCEHGLSSPAMDNQAADGNAQQAGHDQNSSPCGMHAGCAAMGAAVILPAAHHFPLDPATVKLGAAVSSDYTSFVPEGLQRPPRILA